MDLEIILMGVPIILGSALVVQPALKEVYINSVQRRHREGYLDRLPLFAQELNNSTTRSLARIGLEPYHSNIPSLTDRAKSLFYYELTEFPIFKAVYKFLTLDNPEFRTLF